MKHFIAAVVMLGLVAVPALGQSAGTGTPAHPQQQEPPDDYWLDQENAGSTLTAPVHFDIGVRAVSLQEVNASDSYDAVFDGDAMTQVGIQLELLIRESFLIALVYETGEVDGNRVLSVDPPISTCTLPGGCIEETLTLSPIHLTFGWMFAPESQIHGFVGVGPTLLDWEDESGPLSESGNDTGYHGVAGLRWSTPNHRFTVGGELRYSSVPDAVGEEGITGPEFFDEDDLGGTTIGVSLLWRVR